MKTTVIITAYKSHTFIEECLDSVFKQKHLHEVLLSIDACTDTLDKVNEIRSKYGDKLKVFFCPVNVGTFPQRNVLIRKTSGDYILFFDSDDVMRPEMLSLLNRFKDNADVVQFQAYNFGDVLDSRIGKSYFPGGTALYKRGIFNILGGFPKPYLSADSDLRLRIKQFGNLIKIKRINAVLFDRRIHDTNLTRLHPPKFRDKSYKLKRYASILDVYFEPEEIEMVEI